MLIETLPRDWGIALQKLFLQANKELTISSPYISRVGIDLLLKHIPRSFKNAGHLNLISDLSSKNVYQGSTDPNAIMRLFDAGLSLTLFHLPRLHAKVFVQDSEWAIITSGNLTDGGVFRNFEYGISIADPHYVCSIRKDLLDYAFLGASVDRSSLQAYCELADELTELYKTREKSVRSDIEKRFKAVLKDTDASLIARKLAGRSLNSILSKTILYLLDKHGRMPTPKLQAMVQEIHPDLCDDDVLRIINGVRHSAKWKHSVRSAQDSLTRRGLVKRTGKDWELTERATDTSFWLKPIGVIADQVSPNQIFDEEEGHLHFSRNPVGVHVNDILIVYAVGSKKLTSLYRCNSVPMHVDSATVAREPWQSRWPYYLINENLTPTFGREWYGQNITYDYLEDLFLESFPNGKITPNGSRITASLMRGRDKLKLTPEFGKFIVNYVAQKDGNYELLRA